MMAKNGLDSVGELSVQRKVLLPKGTWWALGGGKAGAEEVRGIGIKKEDKWFKMKFVNQVKVSEICF